MASQATATASLPAAPFPFSSGSLGSPIRNNETGTRPRNVSLSDRDSEIASILIQEIIHSDSVYVDDLNLLATYLEQAPDFGGVVDRLIQMHLQLPSSANGFQLWAEQAEPRYREYIRLYWYSLDMPRQMVQLMKRPFGRLTHLAHTLQRIEARLAITAGAEIMQRLAEAARDRSREETDRADRTGFLFTKVRSFETLEPVSARFDTRSIIKRDFFDMQLDHPRATWDRIAVEMILVHEHTYTSVALCSLENPGRALLFPSFRQGDVVLDKRACTNTSLELLCPCVCSWPKTIRLLSSDERKLARWRDVLEAIFPRDMDASQLPFDCDDLGISTPSHGMDHLITPPSSLSRSQMISRLSVGPLTGSLVEQLKDYLTPDESLEIRQEVDQDHFTPKQSYIAAGATPVRTTTDKMKGVSLISPSPSPEHAVEKTGKTANDLVTPSKAEAPQAALSPALSTPLTERLKKAQAVRRQIKKDMQARERQSTLFRSSLSPVQDEHARDMLGFGAMSSEHKLENASPHPATEKYPAPQSVATQAGHELEVPAPVAQRDSTTPHIETNRNPVNSDLIADVSGSCSEAPQSKPPTTNWADSSTNDVSDTSGDLTNMALNNLASAPGTDNEIGPQKKRLVNRSTSDPSELSRTTSMSSEALYPPPPASGPPQLPLPTPGVISVPPIVTSGSGKIVTQTVDLPKTATSSTTDLPMTSSSSCAEFNIPTPGHESRRPLLDASPASASTNADADRTHHLVSQRSHQQVSPRPERPPQPKFNVARRPVMSMIETPATKPLQVPRSQSNEDNQIEHSQSRVSALSTDSEFPSRSHSPARTAFATPAVTNLEQEPAGPVKRGGSKFVRKMSSLRNFIKIRPNRTPRMEFEMVSTPRLPETPALASSVASHSTGPRSGSGQLSGLSPAFTCETGDLMQTPESKILAHMPSPVLSEIRRSNGHRSPPAPVSIFARDNQSQLAASQFKPIIEEQLTQDVPSAHSPAVARAVSPSIRNSIVAERHDPTPSPLPEPSKSADSLNGRNSVATVSSATSDSEYASAVELPTPSSEWPESPLYSRPSTPPNVNSKTPATFNPSTPDTVVALRNKSPDDMDYDDDSVGPPMPEGPPPSPPVSHKSDKLRSVSSDQSLGMAVCEESNNATVERGDSSNMSIRSVPRSTTSGASISSISQLMPLPIPGPVAVESANDASPTATDRSLSTNSVHSLTQSVEIATSVSSVETTPKVGVPQKNMSSVLTIFRGVGWVSVWQEYRWVPLSEKELTLAITLGAEGGSLIVASGSPIQRDISLAPSKTQVRKNTPHDVHIKENDLNLMIRIRSVSSARQFSAAVASTRLDLKNQPLIYTREGKCSTPSLNDTDSSLGSISSSQADNSRPHSPVTSSAALSGIRLPPRLSKSGNTMSSPVVASPRHHLQSVVETEELMLLNDLRCKLLEKDLDGGFVDGPIGKLCVSTALGSANKTLILKDSNPSTSQPLLLERDMPPQAFKRHGRVGISVGLATTEENDVVRFLLQFRGEKEAHHVYELLTAQ